jgi:hypothetical protein
LLVGKNTSGKIEGQWSFAIWTWKPIKRPSRSGNKK